MPEVKPLSWSFVFSLPILAVAVAVVFWALICLERSRMIGQLNAVVTYGSVEEATLAMRQMARFPDPPIEPFVAAATSPTQPVAQEAQLAIGDLLRGWQRQLKAGGDADKVAFRLYQLAEALDEQRESFSSCDFPWLAKTTERIVRLANRASPEGSLGVAVHCDSILAYVSPWSRETMRMELASTVGTVSPVSVTSDFGDTLARLPVAGADQQPVHVAALPLTASIFTLPPRSAYQSITSAGQPSKTGLPQVGGSSRNAAGRSDWQPRWSQPALVPTPARTLPAPFVGEGRSVFNAASPIPVFDAGGMESGSVGPWTTADSRFLLERWLAEDGIEKLSIQRELARRGFAVLPAGLVRTLVSGRASDRVQLVDDVIATPSVNAKAWLMLLADDQAADVRLAAVGVMATSNDPELIEKAWQTALHDRDPRIARLAERLRNRRTNIQHH